MTPSSPPCKLGGGNKDAHSIHLSPPMKPTVSSDSIGMILDDPILRMRLAYAWPKPKCSLCGGSAQGVFEVLFTTGECRCKVRPCAHDEVEDFYEYRLGCHACFTSNWAKGCHPQRDLPTTTMFIRYRRNGQLIHTMITVPVTVKRKAVNFILPISCLSQASEGMREMLS